MIKLNLLLLFLISIFNTVNFAQFGGGTGSENNPYIINDASHFSEIPPNDNPNIFFKQTADITNLVSGLSNFKGTYDGNNYRLNPGSTVIFDKITGTVKNVRTTLSALQNFSNTIESSGWVQNCEITVSSGVNAYGGAVALTSAGSIEDTKVIMEGNASIYGDGTQSAGGIVGEQIGSTSVIMRCSVTGGSITGGPSRGGIAGEGVTIINCAANTTIGTGDYSGGIAGKLLYNNNPVLVAYIGDSYFRGSIQGSGRYRGGITGYASQYATIQRSYAAATLAATSNAAPAIGYVESNVTIGNVFWDAEVQGYFNQSKSLQLDGTNDHVTLPTGIVSSHSNFTIEAWVYWEGGGNWQRVFDFGTGTTVNMFFTPSNGTNARFAITTSGGVNEQRLNAAAPLTTNVWNHIAITLSPSTTTGKLYINGVEAASNTSLSLSPSSLGSTTLNYLGRSQYSADAYFKGKIDEVRIWSVALPLSTINDWRYRYVTADHPNSANLVSYYKIDETSGTTIVNDKNASFNGTLQNGGTFVKDASAAPTDRGFGKLTSDMKNDAIFLAAGYSPSTWFRDDAYNSGYPYLAWENPGGSPLPVELVSFTARISASGVTLRWETKTEVMNLGFDVERKTGDTPWQKIGFIEGNYTTNSPRYYSFNDQPTVSGKIFYRLKQIDSDGGFEYSPEISIELGLPSEFALEQNYPNPFNPETIIGYALPVAGEVSLAIYNSLGEKVVSLVDGIQQPGRHLVRFRADNLPSGIYFYRMVSGNFSSAKKLIISK
jgi:hypothetical protein